MLYFWLFESLFLGFRFFGGTPHIIFKTRDAILQQLGHILYYRNCLPWPNDEISAATEPQESRNCFKDCRAIKGEFNIHFTLFYDTKSFMRNIMLDSLPPMFPLYGIYFVIMLFLSFSSCLYVWLSSCVYNKVEYIFYHTFFRRNCKIVTQYEK